MSEIWYCPPLLHILQGDLWLPKSGKGAHCNAHAFFQQNTHSPLSINTHTLTHLHTYNFEARECDQLSTPHTEYLVSETDEIINVPWMER